MKRPWTVACVAFCIGLAVIAPWPYTIADADGTVKGKGFAHFRWFGRPIMEGKWQSFYDYPKREVREEGWFLFGRRYGTWATYSREGKISETVEYNFNGVKRCTSFKNGVPHVHFDVDHLPP